MSLQLLKFIIFLLISCFCTLAYAGDAEVFIHDYDVEVLPEKQQQCLYKKMTKWHKQREKEISVQCEELSRKDEECRISAGVEAIIEEQAAKKFTVQCKKSLIRH